MKHYYLIANASKDENLAFSKQIISYIEQSGGTAGLATNRDFTVAEIPENVECILVLGGDGTMIRVATQVESLRLPIMGINMGTMGYLCELEKSNVFSAIDQLFEDHFHIEDRMMLEIQDIKNSFALNDVVFHSAGNLNFLCLHVYVNGELLTVYHADGVIISTPTGSTGYNLSAGGPIVDPKAKLILLTPISDHNLASKSIVLSAEDQIEVELGTRRIERDEQAAVSVDGDCLYTMKVGDRIKVSAAPSVVRVCRLNTRSFLELLRKKMEQYI